MNSKRSGRTFARDPLNASARDAVEPRQLGGGAHHTQHHNNIKADDDQSCHVDRKTSKGEEVLHKSATDAAAIFDGPALGPSCGRTANQQ